MGLAPIKAPMGARVVIGGMEVLRTLDELEIEFPGRDVYSWNLFENN